MNIIEFINDKKTIVNHKRKIRFEKTHIFWTTDKKTHIFWTTDKKTHIFRMASFPTHWGVAAPPSVPVIAVALHRLPLAPTELAAGLRLAGRAVGPAPAQMTPLADNSIKLFSQTSQILVKVF